MFNTQKDKSLILKWYKRIKAIKYLGGKCINCGNNNYKHLIFHHTDASIKENNISYIINKKYNKIEKEIKKCILLCNNCHRELHFKNNIKYNDTRETKSLLLNIKNKNCYKCGYNKCDAALTFHHTNKNEKSFLISDIKRIKTLQNLKEEIVNEINKCIILCSNCHNEEEIRHDVAEYVFNNYDKIIIKKVSDKVNRDIVKEMYFEKGIKQIDIAKQLNVSKGTISDIIKKLKTQN